MNPFYSFDERLTRLDAEAESQAAEAFAAMDEVCAYNEAKVLHAFSECRVSESHFAGSTGYGYGDRGREVLDEVYAKVFGAEDALNIRHGIRHYGL